MDGGMIESKKDIITIAQGKGLSEVIKPLSREIHLFDTYIAGTTHISDPAVLDSIKPGDRLILQREDNKFDDKAILVLSEEKTKYGYIPEKDNVIFARLMDAGKLLSGRVKNVEPRGTFRLINIQIFLIDF